MPYLFYLSTKDDYINLSHFKHFLSGLFYGLGFFTIYLGWIKEPFLLDNLTKNYSIFSYLLIIYCAIYFGIIFIILNYFKKLILKFIALPLLIVSAEIICSSFVYGFPWFSFSLIHSTNLFGTSLIFFLGTYSLSFLTILIFMLPCVFFIKEIKYNRFLIILYLIILILSILLILFKINEKNNKIINQKTVSLVQLNYLNNQNLTKEKIIEKSNEIINIIKNNHSEIIIFGENDYPFLMDNNSIETLQKNIKEKQVIIIGSTRKENEKYFNSFFLIDKYNYQLFDKKILVPFGEFIPFRYLFKFMEFIVGSVDYSIGKKSRLLTINQNIKILPVICYEIIYFWKLFNNENQDSQIIINLTNDSWFGTFSGPYQHFYFTKLRAAEFNKPLLRVSSNGVSAIINNNGKIIDFIKLNEKNIKDFKINIGQNKNKYLYLHKITFIFIFIFLFLVFILQKKNEYKKI